MAGGDCVGRSLWLVRVGGLLVCRGRALGLRRRRLVLRGRRGGTERVAAVSILGSGCLQASRLCLVSLLESLKDLPQFL